MDIVFVKKYLQENLGFSDKKIDKINKYIDLLLNKILSIIFLVRHLKFIYLNILNGYT